MLVVALTGGIGSGKSAVSHHLESLGVPVIDADGLARRLVEPGSTALLEIRQEFGDMLINPDGSLDRTALRNTVFNQSEKRQRLEAILHPRIREAMKSWIARQSSPYVVLVIPLLFETGQTDLADRILVVDCEEDLQIQRASSRDGQTRDQIKRIMHAQVDRQTRLQGADDIIENNGSLESLIEATERLHHRYLALAAD